MPVMPGRGGLAPAYRLPDPPSFARPSQPAAGNDLPPITGKGFRRGTTAAGPHPPSQPLGNPDLGDNDGFWGSNNGPNGPGVPPVLPQREAWSEGQAFGVGQGRESFRRYGLQGFNDKLTVKDRHAYWDTGRQLTGTDFIAGSSGTNTYNNPKQEPPVPNLRTVNRTVSYQIGSDASRNQDDLARGYTWLGEQGSGWAPVWGGTPGLYLPYGSRGGVPYPLVGPERGGPGDGRQVVNAGPPHGLHSLTYPNNGDTLQRYAVNPQMRPVRFDRPSNSPQAGQSYNQTVVPQGGFVPAQARAAWTARIGGRGWLGSPQ